MFQYLARQTSDGKSYLTFIGHLTARYLAVVGGLADIKTKQLRNIRLSKKGTGKVHAC